MQKICKFLKNPYILSLLSYAAILYQLDTYTNYNGYKFLFLLLFVGLVVLFKKFNFDKVEKRQKKYALILSSIVSSLLVIGRTVLKYEFTPSANLITFKSLALNIIFILCLIPLLYVLSIYLITFINKINLNKKPQLDSKKFGLIAFGTILLGKIPYLLAFFPGVMTIDSLNTINLFEKGILYNNHPVVFTYFFGFIYKLGKMIFKSGTMGIAFFMIVQAIIISLILTYLLKYLNKKGVPKIIIYLLLIYYAFSPDFGYMSVTLWKDVLFGIAFIPYILSLLKISESLNENRKIDWKTYLMFIISSLMILFFRNNGCYVYIISTIGIIIFFIKKNKVIPIISACLVVLFYIVTGPVYDKLNVTPGRTVEKYSILLQQVGRVYLKNGKFDKETDKYFRELIDTEKLQEKYLTWIADPMKGLTNNEMLTNTKDDFMKYWFKGFLSNPITYVESFLSSSLGYWYPDVVYISVRESSENVAEVYDVTKYGIYKNSLLPEKVTNLIRLSTVKSMPLSMIIWSPGFSFIILIISLIMSLYFKLDKKYFTIYFPLAALWLTNVIAAPVYCEYRYIFGLIVCNVLLVATPIIYKRKIK